MQRVGRPGMPPSPNQKIVLDALKKLDPVREGFGDPGFSIDFITQFLANGHEGGVVMAGGPQKGQWVAWSRSTVRDHLNDLVLKDLVVKSLKPRAYYRVKP